MIPGEVSWFGSEGPKRTRGTRRRNVVIVLVAVGLVVSPTRSGPQPQVAAAEEVLEDLQARDDGLEGGCDDPGFPPFRWHVADGQIHITHLNYYVRGLEARIRREIWRAGLPPDILASPMEELIWSCHPAGI